MCIDSLKIVFYKYIDIIMEFREIMVYIWIWNLLQMNNKKSLRDFKISKFIVRV